ncbi:gamma-butyrobetaine hydroxylase-like domain-containing protein [Salinisphaera sp. Q1T1-3]|uniref:gamma-butyrobetaine hydroxylase-like domain-containing protein n=1 Tax=Salinisphaera sp. Q1T1-3 TaxID=2321229 RepID=UPI000E73C147|nr:DUF971 domain-containing protein [Salinisphaera sp. Q1T1-3]RJS92830.1 DUF971 domain-containing protein [Salinisphaera sp. Q1T1-3]
MTDVPTDITLHQKSGVLEVVYSDGAMYNLPLEYLRVYSPSAEVRGHGGPMKLVTGKKDIGVEKIEPVGNYAIQLFFDDGHNTGIFSWETLRELGADYERNWQAYLARLDEAGASRERQWH